MPNLKKILVAEDDTDIAEIVLLSLEQVGNYDVRISHSGKDAYNEALSFLPDLILLDVMMPGQDGPETLKQLRNNDDMKNIPVIFLTAKANKDEISKLMELGAIAVISKPFDPMLLPEQIKKIWKTNQRS
jgi:DNA-binding response OmpR family regulator